MFPEPDGLLSILLIFPIIIFGSRFAGAPPIEKTRGRRIATRLVLGICVLLLAILPLLGPIASLVALFYGIFCGIQIMRRGEARKRFLIGAFVIAWSGFAIADYGASSFAWHGTILASNEASAAGTLRRLSSAEEKFSDPTRSGPAKEARYGTIEDLRNNRLIDVDLEAGKQHKGYVFHEVVDPGKKQFLFYAVAMYLPSSEVESGWAHFLPGSSLYFHVWHRDKSHGTGARSFAVDQTGTIRFTAEPTKAPVMREEAAHWVPLSNPPELQDKY